MNSRIGAGGIGMINTNDPHAMNKRLYAIDVALVGKDEAPKRWHRQFGSRKPWILCAPNGPNWDDIFQYRRATYAPPLPSWDWHEAPEWATDRRYFGNTTEWMATRCCSLHGRVESRPPQSWFDATADMTRAEYESLQRLARGEAVEPASDDLADDGVLSGAEAKKVLANAILNGEQPDSFETVDSQGSYSVAAWWQIWVRIEKGSHGIRRKPKTCHLIDANGVRHEWPEPVRGTPISGTRFWLKFDGDTTGAHEPHEWDALSDDHDLWLTQRRCHATREARDSHERALIAASTAGGTDV